MKIDRTLVYPSYIYEAIAGARLSYGSTMNSDSVLWEDGSLNIGPEDVKLVRKLLSGEGGEDKLLRAIPVSCFISAPLKWWVEMDTYKVGTVRQSSSLMHRLQRVGQFTPEDFDVRDRNAPEFQRMLVDLNALHQKWVDAGGRRGDLISAEWTDWQDLIPRSYVYRSHWVGNYAVLRNIYFQRRKHRLLHWRTFCIWVQSLPYASLFITYEKERPQ